MGMSSKGVAKQDHTIRIFKMKRSLMKPERDKCGTYCWTEKGDMGVKIRS